MEKFNTNNEKRPITDFKGGKNGSKRKRISMGEKKVPYFCSVYLVSSKTDLHNLSISFY